MVDEIVVSDGTVLNFEESLGFPVSRVQSRCSTLVGGRQTHNVSMDSNCIA